MFLEDIHARGFAPSAILDVGAHSGGWSKTAVSIFRGAEIFMIEPKVEMEPHLKSFQKEYPRSKYFLCGAGPREEIKTLSLWPNYGEGTSFLPAPQDNLANAGIQRKVEIVTIDSLISAGKILPPNLLKVDVEGFEIEVLKGASKALVAAEVVILEASLYRRLPGMPLIHEIINFMVERDFSVYDFPGLHKRPELGVLHIVDICFVRNTSPLLPTIKGLYTE